MTQIAVYPEPLYRYEIELRSLPTKELEVIPVQRKPSRMHVHRLEKSIQRIGFVTPLVVVLQEGKYRILDGQHRWLAARSCGIEEVPCLLLPEKYARQLMELNVEKQMNLREKCHVTVGVWREFLSDRPDLPETDSQISEALEQGCYVTIGLTYEKNARFSGSAFEPLLKKVDFFLPQPLREAKEERDRRSGVILSLHGLVSDCVGKINALGITHPFLYKEILSFSNPMKRKRKVAATFDSFFDQVRSALEDLRENPAKFRKHRFSPAE